MNAVFKLEVISFRKLVKDFACVQVSNQAPQILCEALFRPLSQCSLENYWAWKAFVVCIQGQGFSRFVDNMLNKMD